MAAKNKILVISSDQAMLVFFRKNFNGNGYQLVSTQYTGDELWSVINQEFPDLVILDIMMPGLDGIEVCLRIRQWSEVPIMMLSAWGAGGDKVRGLDFGSDSYLTEPIGVDEVIDRINRVLQCNLAALNFSSNIRSGIS